MSVAFARVVASNDNMEGILSIHNFGNLSFNNLTFNMKARRARMMKGRFAQNLKKIYQEFLRPSEQAAKPSERIRDLRYKSLKSLQSAGN